MMVIPFNQNNMLLALQICAIIFLSCTLDVSAQIKGSVDSIYRCTAEGFFVDPNNCQGFYRCVPNGFNSFSAVHFECASGTVFDPDVGGCNYAYDTNRPDCVNVVGTMPDHNILEHPTPLSTAAPSTDVSIETPCDREGFLGDLYNCRKFYRCISDSTNTGRFQQFVFQCSDDTVWDVSVSSCNHPWAAQTVSTCETPDTRASAQQQQSGNSAYDSSSQYHHPQQTGWNQQSGGGGGNTNNVNVYEHQQQGGSWDSQNSNQNYNTASGQNHNQNYGSSSLASNQQEQGASNQWQNSNYNTGSNVNSGQTNYQNVGSSHNQHNHHQSGANHNQQNQQEFLTGQNNENQHFSIDQNQQNQQSFMNQNQQSTTNQNQDNQQSLTNQNQQHQLSSTNLNQNNHQSSSNQHQQNHQALSNQNNQQFSTNQNEHNHQSLNNQNHHSQQSAAEQNLQNQQFVTNQNHHQTSGAETGNKGNQQSHGHDSVSTNQKHPTQHSPQSQTPVENNHQTGNGANQQNSHSEVNGSQNHHQENNNHANNQQQSATSTQESHNEGSQSANESGSGSDTFAEVPQDSSLHQGVTSKPYNEHQSLHKPGGISNQYLPVPPSNNATKPQQLQKPGPTQSIKDEKRPLNQNSHLNHNQPQSNQSQNRPNPGTPSISAQKPTHSQTTNSGNLGPTFTNSGQQHRPNGSYKNITADGDNSYPSCTKEGVFKDPNDCLKFYECVKIDKHCFQQYNYICLDGSIWDQYSMSCILTEPVQRECNRGSSKPTTNITVASNSNGVPNKQPPQFPSNPQSPHPSPASDTCTGEGFFGDETRCSNFYRCVPIGPNQYRQYQFSCGPGTVWDDSINSCNHAWATPGKCGTIQSPTENGESSSSMSTVNPCQTSGFFGNQMDCTKFYRCVDTGSNTYHKYEFSCGPGTIWDDEQSTCNHAWAVPNNRCATTGSPEQRPVSQASPPYGNQQPNKPTDYQPTNSNHPKPDYAPPPNTNQQVPQTPPYGSNNQKEPNTATPPVANNQITTSQNYPNGSDSPSSRPNEDGKITNGECSKEGFAEDPTSCTVFYRCVNNGDGGLMKYVFTCGSGTVWDQSVLSCNHRWAVPGRCGDTGGNTNFVPQTDATANHNEPPRPLDTNLNQVDQSYPNQNQDGYFYPPPSSSPASLTGSQNQLHHPPTDNFERPITFTCTTSGFVANPQDCKKFYRCVDNGKEQFLTYEFECGPGTVWDTATESCNHHWAVAGSCGTLTVTANTSATDTPPVTTTTSSSKPDDSNCTKEGYIADMTDCRKYYHCVRGNNSSSIIKHSYSCSPDKIWDQNQSICVTANNSMQQQCQSMEELVTSTESMLSTSSTSSHTMPSETNDNATTEITSSSTAAFESTTYTIATSTDGVVSSTITTEGSTSVTIVPTTLSSSSMSSTMPTTELTNTTATDDSTMPTQTTNTPTGTLPGSTVTFHTSSGTTMTQPTIATPTTDFASTSTSSQPSTELAMSTLTSAFFSTSTTAATPTTSHTVTTDMGSDISTTTEYSSSNSPNKKPSCPIGELEGDQITLVCPTGLRRHPKYCNLLYQCTEGEHSQDYKIVVFSCPVGTIFDDKRIQCVEPSLSDQQCEGEISNSKSSRTVRQSSLVPMELDQKPLCPNVGYHAHTATSSTCSSTFIRCEQHAAAVRAYMYQCPTGYVFWKVSRQCERRQRLQDCVEPEEASNHWNIPVEILNVSRFRRRLTV